MKYFVASGPNHKTRKITITDLIEGNKTLKLAVVEDVINSFYDQGIISINLELSSNRVTKYDFNQNYEEHSFLDDVFTTIESTILSNNSSTCIGEVSSNADDNKDKTEVT